MYYTDGLSFQPINLSDYKVEKAAGVYCYLLTTWAIGIT